MSTQGRIICNWITQSKFNFGGIQIVSVPITKLLQSKTIQKMLYILSKAAELPTKSLFYCHLF